jgi:hypothetical protein
MHAVTQTTHTHAYTTSSEQLGVPALSTFDSTTMASETRKSTPDLTSTIFSLWKLEELT